MKNEKISRRKYIAITSTAIIAVMFGGIANLVQNRTSLIKGSNLISNSSSPKTSKPSLAPTPKQNFTITSTTVLTTPPLTEKTPIPSDTIPKMTGGVKIDRDFFYFNLTRSILYDLTYLTKVFFQFSMCSIIFTVKDQ